MPDNIKLFEDREIRTSWNENEEDYKSFQEYNSKGFYEQ